jgi:hypothetical protein
MPSDPDPVAAGIVEARAVLARFKDCGYDILDDSRGWNEADVADLTGWTECLLAAVEAVLKRHAPTGAFPPGSDVCTECGIERDVPWSWPCPTIEAISAALLGKEATDA